MDPAEDSNASQEQSTEPPIVSKMRYAGIAYQQFLLSLSLEDEDETLEQGRQLFDQHYQWIQTITQTIKQEKQINPDFPETEIANLLENLQTFQNEFMHFYQLAFEQFKQQHSALIAKDTMQAFRQWIRAFDTQYLSYVRQASVCRQSAEILRQGIELSRTLSALKSDDNSSGL